MTPLTKEQFNKAREAGFSTDQIVEFEKKRMGAGLDQPINATPEPRVGFFGKVPLSAYQSGERNIMGNIFERPGAALRSLILGKGYIEGANNPTDVPKFQDLALGALYNTPSARKYPYLTALTSGPAVSAAGLTADIATDPAALLSLIIGKTPMGGGKTAGGVLAESKVGQAVSRVANAPIEKVVSNVIEKVNIGQVNNVIDKSISKAIRPSVSGKSSAGQMSSYYSKARQAVSTIYDNRNSLQFIDETGQVVNKLPESLNEFSSAISQTKGKIFDQYNAIAGQAGKKGASVDLNPIANEVEKVASNKTITTLYPEVRNYALTKVRALRQAGSFTAQESQDAIKMLNNSLDAFYKNPTFETASKAEIDAGIVNNMRKSLDNTIETLTGNQYQVLKNQYGALKSIEKDVVHRAVVDARKNMKGLIDFTDVLSGGQMTRGILTLNPSEFATGVVQKGIANYLKMRNDPNKIVKNMFRIVERAGGKFIAK